MRKILFSLVSLGIYVIIGTLSVRAQTEVNWPMAGGNPQRTSWISVGVSGQLKGEWAKPIEPYISAKTQIIAAEDKIFLSTAKGLYAFDAATGNQLWVYPTSMPLGHSPTYLNGVLYVGGFDRMIHKINAGNGQKIWTFTGGAGFSTNPLVVNNTVYAGNRDGKMYAVDATSGLLKWTFVTNGPILFSAAYHAGDNIIYFGSNDMYAYALNATSGSQIWKSPKLPGLGMHSWWPVVHGNYVYISVVPGYQGKLFGAETAAFYSTPGEPTEGTPYGQLGTIAGDWAAGYTTMDASKKTTGINISMTEYLEGQPQRRSLIALNRTNGTEKTYDFDADGNPDYIPALWSGFTGSLNRFPPVVGSDGVIYFRNHTHASGAIPGGVVTGWKVDSPILNFGGSREIGGNGDYPIDEPAALSAGGNIVYHTMCCSRFITSYDISKPNSFPGPLVNYVNPGNDNLRQWRFNNWTTAGYESELQKFFLHPDQITANELMYYGHADNNPPIPYKGKVYLHRGNALIALSPTGNIQLKPKASSPSQPTQPTRTVSHLQGLLDKEVEKIIGAGHLRSGIVTVGLHDLFINAIEPYALHLFHNPSETYISLLKTIPHLSEARKTQLRLYLTTEWSSYSAANTKHVGFTAGAPRESHLPMEVKVALPGKITGVGLINYYASWKYAQEFSGALAIYNALSGIPSPLTPAEFSASPQRLNEYIAGYKGYYELKKLATGQSDAALLGTLNSLMSQRAANFVTHPNTGLSGTGGRYAYSMTPALNFMHMTPELATYLKTNALSKVTAAVNEYNTMFPHWFVARGEEMQGEGSMQPPQYYHGLFQAKAYILNESYSQLEPFLDAPGFAVGDLYYIDNLVAAIEAGPGGPTPTNPPVSSPTTVPSSTPTPSYDPDLNNDGQVNSADITLLLTNYGLSSCPNIADANFDCRANTFDFGVIANAIPVPTPTAGAAGGLDSGTGQAKPPTWPLPTGTMVSQMHSLMDQAIAQAKTDYGSDQAKLVVLQNNDTLLANFATKAQQAFPQALVVGGNTKNPNYNAFTDNEFAEHDSYSLAVLALGGSSISQVRVSGQHAVGAGYITAGEKIAQDLKPHINPSLRNLIYYIGPGHNPSHRLLLCGFKQGMAGVTNFCDSGNPNNPELPGLPALASHVHVIGTAEYLTGSSVVNTTVVSQTVIGVLIQGTFKLAMAGMPANPTTANIATPINQMVQELGGQPDHVFLVPAHPAAGSYAALRSQFVSLLPAATIFGHEGGGEIGQDLTFGATTADIDHMFMAGLKAN